MRIEVFSDVICPWCFVGHARLQQALAARSDRDIEVQCKYVITRSSSATAESYIPKYVITRSSSATAESYIPNISIT